MIQFNVQLNSISLWALYILRQQLPLQSGFNLQEIIFAFIIIWHAIRLKAKINFISIQHLCTSLNRNAFYMNTLQREGGWELKTSSFRYFRVQTKSCEMFCFWFLKAQVWFDPIFWLIFGINAFAGAAYEFIIWVLNSIGVENVIQYKVQWLREGKQDKKKKEKKLKAYL